MSSKGGRPLFNGQDLKIVLQKLEEAFMLGATDQEACIYADISTSAFYEYQKKDPEFLERKTALKNLPSLGAKKAIIDRFDKDPALAQWWLTKLKSDEFGDSPQQIQRPIDLSEKAKNVWLNMPPDSTPRTADQTAGINRLNLHFFA